MPKLRRKQVVDTPSTGAKKGGRKRAAKKRPKSSKGSVSTTLSPPASARRGRSSSVSAPKSGQWMTISIRTQGGAVSSLHSSENLQSAAMQWSYVLRNRRRWSNSESARTEMAGRCQELLQKFGLDKNTLHELAQSEIIEVSIPYRDESEGWEARIFPWEYMLSAATRSFRKKPLTVIRHLDRTQELRAQRDKKPERLMIIESAPGLLRDKYDFIPERNLVKTNLKLQDFKLLEDETRERVRAGIKEYAPSVIHVSAFDNHQATGLGVLQREKTLDGILMPGEMESLDSVEAAELAALLNAAERKPIMVACNIYNSAARIAPLIVAEGAGAAIGFQDEFNDALTELFFASFYEQWRRFKWDVLEAFRFACDVLRSQPKGLIGTGVVLWSERSLVKPQTAQSQKIGSDSLAEQNNLITLNTLPDKDARHLLKVEVKARDNLNYSMLHNNCQLFEKFVLRKDQPGRMHAIQIEVVLYVGAKTYSYRSCLDMEQKVQDLNDQIRVPLLYSMDLFNNENIHTALYVEVKWEGQLLHSETYRVTLPPLDEWRDNTTDRVWLPSFILPRDPAVGKIVGMGENYLMALKDDSGAGFDGYQSIDVSSANPYEGVDQQVKALWAALIYSLNISYINPPPSYTLTSQRLRTPSEVYEGRRGTCIDLSLLLASCLEYIDIYPVIFLLKGHAFPGYWRGSQLHEEFKQVSGVFQQQQPPPSAQTDEVTTVQKWPWYHAANAYEEIMLQVEQGKLMPVETVFITNRGKFTDALDEAHKKLMLTKTMSGDAPLKFDGMIDIAQARSNLITPIPRY